MLKWASSISKDLLFLLPGLSRRLECSGPRAIRGWFFFFWCACVSLVCPASGTSCFGWEMQKAQCLRLAFLEISPICWLFSQVCVRLSVSGCPLLLTPFCLWARQKCEHCDKIARYLATWVSSSSQTHVRQLILSRVILKTNVGSVLEIEAGSQVQTSSQLRLNCETASGQQDKIEQVRATEFGRTVLQCSSVGRNCFKASLGDNKHPEPIQSSEAIARPFRSIGQLKERWSGTPQFHEVICQSWYVLEAHDFGDGKLPDPMRTLENPVFVQHTTCPRAPSTWSCMSQKKLEACAFEQHGTENCFNQAASMVIQYDFGQPILRIEVAQVCCHKMRDDSGAADGWDSST